MASAIGATAISSVIRSSWISAVPRRGRSDGAGGRSPRPPPRPAGSTAPGCARAASPPGTGRRAEPERHAPVCRGQRDGALRVADRLGPIGRAGAEDEDGVVGSAAVVERRGHRAGAVEDCAARLVVEVEDARRRRGARPAGRRRRRRPRRTRGAVNASAVSTSSAFQAGLSRTGAAPTLLAAWTTTTNSGRLEVITARRSPGPTPCTASGAPRRCLPCSSAKVQRRHPRARRDDRGIGPRPTRARGA